MRRTSSKYFPLLAALALFVLTQGLIIRVADISQAASKQIVKEKRRWGRSRDFPRVPDGKDTVLFFGNSLVAAGIVPEVFDRALGGATESYNLSLVGLQAPPHYFLLKDYLARHPAPKYIFINTLDGGYDIESFPSYAVQGAGFWEALRYAWMRRNPDVFLNYLIPSRLHWPEVLRYGSGKLLRVLPARVREMHKKAYLGRFEKEQWGHNREYFYEMSFVRPEQLRRERLAMLRENRGYYYIKEESVTGGQVSEEFLKQFDITLEQPCPEGFGATAAEASPAVGAVFDGSKVDPFARKLIELAGRHKITVVFFAD